MYLDVEEFILINIFFIVKLGEIIVFIGSIGSGKLIFINLIFCFFDVIEGEILFGGVNIKNVF